MINKLISLAGILLTELFIGGYLILFWLNPKTLEEINTLSLFVFNLEGMEGRIWAVSVIYLAVGILNILFSIGLFILSKNKSIIVVGKIFLLISGILWLSFGIIPFDTQTGQGGNIFLIRVITIILTTAIGLVVIGAELEKIYQSKFLKWYTVSSGLLILLLGVLSTEVYNYDDTWVRTNVSLAIYFIWFGVYGAINLIRSYF